MLSIIILRNEVFIMKKCMLLFAGLIAVDSMASKTSVHKSEGVTITDEILFNDIT